MTVTAAVSALRHDAAVWDEVAQVTRLGGQEAAGLTLGASQLSWASEASGLLGTYAEIQDRVVTLLGEATTVYRDLSAALDDVASAYEISDSHAATKFKGVWDVRE